jgi:hypothetical protein
MERYLTQGMYRYNSVEMQLIINALQAYQQQLAKEATESANEYEEQAADEMFEKVGVIKDQMEEDLSEWIFDIEAMNRA